MQQTNHTNPCEFLKCCIVDIKRDNARLSSTQISRRIGVPKSTLNRIENLEVDKPTFKHALSIIRESCSSDQTKVLPFIRKYYPEMSETFERVYSGNSDVDFISPEAEVFFEDPRTHECMILATSEYGTTEEYILEYYGKQGLQTLQDLLSKKILLKENNKIKLGKNKRINAEQETVQKLLANLVSLNYDVSTFGQKENWLSVQYESVDKAYVMPKMLAIMKKANEGLRELFTSPSSYGKDVIWAGLAMDCLENKGRQQ